MHLYWSNVETQGTEIEFTFEGTRIVQDSNMPTSVMLIFQKPVARKEKGKI